MSEKRPRLAVRAVILRDNCLLLVNAYRGSDALWCAPGGGVDLHQALQEALQREVREETGLEVDVGMMCLVNEFHDPDGDFHQVDIYFRCTVTGGDPEGEWVDPEGIVTHRRWVTRAEMANMRVKPDSLAGVAFGEMESPFLDPLEPIVKI
jgi:ADP-ribose pyrophosphatase YjhB (NUDIX family)